MEMDEIGCAELKARLERDDKPLVLDVRETWEVELASIPGAANIPMGEIPARLSELDPGRETVVVCHRGIRSAQVALYLERRGFKRVINLIGGIDAWSREADPSVPRY
jgi:rhodanese-related sulfurtransferase